MSKIQKSKKITYSVMSVFLRKFSVIIAYYLNKVGIQPNRVVLFRVFVFGGLSIYLFSSELYRYNIWGLFSIFLCYFFDLVDGDLARNHDMKTDLGKFLDEELDSFVVTSLVLTFAVKFYVLDYTSLYVYGGMFALFGIIGSAKMTNMFQARFGINCVSGNSLVEESRKQKEWDTRSEFIYQLVTPKNFLLSFFSNFRYYLLFGILTGHIHIAVLLFAIAINIRGIVLFICVTKYYGFRDTGKPALAVFKVMKTLERTE